MSCDSCWLGSPPADWLLVLLAAGGTIAAVRNLVLLRTQTKAAIDGVALTRTQQRPWVGLLRPTAVAVDDRVLFQLQIQNSGSTPATRMRVQSYFLTRPAGAPIAPPDPTPFRGGASAAVLLPGADQFVRVDGPLNGEPAHDSIMRGELEAYVYARITYDDVVSVTSSNHVTEICVQWSGDNRFVPTWHHNTAT